MMTAFHALRVTFLLVCMMAAGFGPAAAQGSDPIILTEPDAWSRGRSLSVTEGDTIRVRGVATHTSGIARVLINGVEAELRRDPAFPNLVDFSGVAIAAAGSTGATITLVPVSGTPVEQRFALEVAAAARPPMRPQPVRPPAQPSGGNPWRSFGLRGVGYGVLAAGGVALTMRTKTESSERCEQVGSGQDCFLRVEETPQYRSAGLALIGVAAAGFVIDAFMTSRRARADGIGSGQLREESDAGASVHLGLPEVVSTHGGRVEVALLRLRF
jgi:hypothetical protein